MTITQLKYFLAICESGKIRIASERLHVSEPTISVAIKRLEDELGVQLFIRSRKQLTLTDAGIRLQEKAGKVVADFDRLKVEIRQPQGKFSVIRLGAPSTISETICPPLIAAFTESHPFVLFESHAFSPSETVQQIEEGKIDLAICDKPTILSQQLVSSLIIRSTMSGYVRDDHPLAGKEDVTPEMLRSEGLILLREKGLISDQIRQWFHDGGIEPNFFLYSNRELLNIIFSMIKQQGAVAFLLDELYTHNQQLQPFPPAHIATFSLSPPLSFDFVIIRKKGVSLSQDAHRFFEFCSQYPSSQ